MRLLLTIVVCLGWVLGSGVKAQTEDDNGFLVNLLQDNLSGPGRYVRLSDVDGLLSSNARIGAITVADDQGVWLTISNAQISWTRSALFRRVLDVEFLTAETIEVTRKPIADQSLPAAQARSFAIPELPIAVDITQVSAEEIILPAEVLGIDARLTFESSVLLDQEGLRLLFDGQRLDGPGGDLTIDLGFIREGSVMSLDVDMSEPQNGVIANALGIVGEPALRASVSGEGPVSDLAITLAVEANETQIVNGIVNLRSDAQEYIFTADLAARLADFVDERYQSFFDGESVLTLTGRTRETGAVDIETFVIATSELSVTGSMLMEPGGFPEMLMLDGEIRSDDGSEVRIPIGENGLSVASGDLTVRFGTDGSEAWVARLNLTDVAGEMLVAQELGLRFEGKAVETDISPLNRVSGTLQANISGAAFTDLGLDDVIGGNIDLSSRVDWQTDGPLVLHWLRLSTASMEAEARGRVQGLTFDGRVEADIRDISRFARLAGRPISGAVVGEMVGTFTLLDYVSDIRFDVRAQDLETGVRQVDPYLVGESELEGRFQRDVTGTYLHDAVIQSALADIKADIGLTDTDVEATLSANLTEVAPILSPLAGEGDLNVRLSGPWEAVTVSGDVVTSNGAELRVEGSAGDRLALAVTLETIPLGIMNTYMSQPRLSGLVSGQADISGTPADPTIGFSLQADQVRTSATADYFAAPLDITATGEWSATGLTLQQTKLVGDGLALTIAGTIDRSFETLSARINGRAALRLAAPVLSRAGIVADGEADLDVDISGQIVSPRVNGRVTISGAQFAVTGQNIRLTNANVRAVLSGQQVRLEQATADIQGGGGVSAQGTLGISNGFPVDMTVQLSNAAYSNGRNISTSLDGQLNVSGSVANGPLIAGDIKLGPTEIQLSASSTQLANLVGVRHVAPPNAVVSTLARAGLTSEGTEIETSGGSLRLDIQVSARDQLFVRGRGVDAEFGGQIRVGGRLGALEAVGGIDMIRGRINVLDRRLDFTRGVVTLSGNLDPRIDFLAETRVADTLIGLRLSGSASAPDLALSSSPPLPEDELLARLIFGRDLSQLSLFQIAQLASAVAALTGEGSGGLVEGLRQSAGLSNLDIRTNDDGETAVAAGQSLGEGFYTEVEVASDGETTLNINLDVMENVTAKGSVSNDGETSIGIFYERDY